MEYGRVLFYLLLCLQQTHGSVVRGLKMCEVECKQTKECNELWFDPVHLMCITGPEKETFKDTQTDEIVTVIKPAIMEARLQKCSRGERLILSKGSAWVCINSAGEPKTSKSRFLWMVSRDRDTKSATVMNVKTRGPKTEQIDFPWSPVFSMVYSQKHTKLFLGLEKSTISTPLRNFKATLVEPAGTLRMRLDEDSDLLFFMANLNTLKMSRIGQKEGNIETVLTINNFFGLFHMDLDVQQKLIYIVRSDGIYPYSYNGTETNRRIRISDTSGLTFFQGYLYFIWNSTIMKTLTVNDTRSVIAQVDGVDVVHDMKVFDGHVYISQSDGSKDMLVIDISNSGSRRKLTIPDGGTNSFCFV